MIFEQGDPADAFYLVRTGFMKVAQSHMGGDHVLNYIGPGGYFGEIGLLADIPKSGALASRRAGGRRPARARPRRPRRISAEAFQEILAQFPDVRRQVTSGHRAPRRKRRDSTDRDVPLAEFLSQGLINAQTCWCSTWRNAPAATNAPRPARTPTTA